MKTTPALLLALSLSFAAQAGIAPSAKTSAPLMTEANWKDHTSSPVADLIYFEDPIPRTEIRPVFMLHHFDDDFITAGGESYVFGLRLGYAVTPRFGVYLNKGGYLLTRPGNGNDQDGWANTGIGLKYLLVDDMPHAFALTVGAGYEIPMGNKAMFWGRGDGEFHLYTTMEKGWGDFHLMATAGLRLPTDTEAYSTTFHYAMQADYFVNRWFIPFVSGAGYTVVDAGHSLPIGMEGADAQNFGSAGSQGTTNFMLGAGFRSRITDSIDVGFAYQKGVNKPLGIFDDRYTIDVMFKF